jgi:hypothetical protein
MPRRRCADCPAWITRGKRCRPCARTHRRANGNHWRTATAGTRTDWRDVPGARDLITQIRARAAAGERCHFWRHPDHPQCPGPIDLSLDGRRHRWAFTVHHLARRMHGGPAVPHTALAAPAHRACNSRDGLLAQNRRRRTALEGLTGSHVAQRDQPGEVPLPVERTSEAW